MTIPAWIFLGATVILFSLYWRGVNERNHLTYYAGMLLLDDDLREAHKQKLDTYLLDSDATNPDELSIRTQQAIQGLANRLAASSVLAFDGAVWNRKRALEKAK